MTQVVAVVGGTVNLWGRNSDKWFTSRRWHHRLAPTPRRRDFPFLSLSLFVSHLPYPERNKLGLPRKRSLVASSRLRSTDLPVMSRRLYTILHRYPYHRQNNYASFAGYVRLGSFADGQTCIYGDCIISYRYLNNPVSFCFYKIYLISVAMCFIIVLKFNCYV